MYIYSFLLFLFSLLLRNGGRTPHVTPMGRGIRERGGGVAGGLAMVE